MVEDDDDSDLAYLQGSHRSYSELSDQLKRFEKELINQKLLLDMMKERNKHLKEDVQRCEAEAERREDEAQRQEELLKEELALQKGRVQSMERIHTAITTARASPRSVSQSSRSSHLKYV